MSRRALKVPSYCLHKASGRAVVRLGGRDVYLGEYGSPESHEEYERVIAEWRSGRYGRTVPPSHARRPVGSERSRDQRCRSAGGVSGSGDKTLKVWDISSLDTSR